MDWKDVAAILPKGLDLLGAGLSIAGNVVPGAGAAGSVVSGIGAVVAHALGVDGTPDAVAAAIKLDPAAAAKLMEVQDNNRTALQQALIAKDIAMGQQALDERKAQLSDVASARERDVHIIQATGHNWRADILAYAAIALFGVTLLCLIFREVSAGSGRDLLFYALGSLTTIVIMVYSFEFGASQTDKTGDQKSLMNALKQRAGFKEDRG